jgi:HSP20 family protein
MIMTAPTTVPTTEKPVAPAKAEQRPARMHDLFDGIDQLQREMARLWGEMSPLLPRAFGRPSGRFTEAGTTWAPRVDVFTKDGDLVVKAELPGLKKEDVRIELEDNALIVQGERRSEHEVKEEDYYRCERAYGRFYRYLPLDFEADASKIKANFKDGVLEVHIPRPASSEPKSRSIPISS